MNKATLRAALIAAVMVATSLIAVAVTPRTFLADLNARATLAQIVPKKFGHWEVDNSIVPIAPSPDLQQVLDETYDETLALTYRNTDGRRVMLSLAYGRNQHKGMNTHRPEICYPAQGFKLTSAISRESLHFDQRAIPVTRVVAEMGPRKEPITYWLMVGDELTHFGYEQRWVAIRYGLRGLVPDGVLVRVSSIEPDTAAAWALQDAFIQDFLAAIPPNQLPRLLGTH